MDDELVKVIRIRKTEGEKIHDDDFSQQVIAGVRFSPLLLSPISEVIIPAKVWEPNAHRFYPDSFCEASKQLLLCSNAEYIQAPPADIRPDFRVNLAAMLPKVIWMEILTFIHRDCKLLFAKVGKYKVKVQNLTFIQGLNQSKQKSSFSGDVS